jgi:hypothetical protein
MLFSWSISYFKISFNCLRGIPSATMLTIFKSSHGSPQSRRKEGRSVRYGRNKNVGFYPESSSPISIFPCRMYLVCGFMPSPWTQSIGHELIQITNVGRELFDGKFISVLKLHLRGNTSTTSCMNCVKGLLHSRLGMQSLVQEAAKRIVHWLHCFFHFP